MVVAESVVLSQLAPPGCSLPCVSGCYVATPALFMGGRAGLKMKGSMMAGWRVRLTDTFRTERANVTNLPTGLEVFGVAAFANKALVVVSPARRNTVCRGQDNARC